jgi:hypothetical protein
MVAQRTVASSDLTVTTEQQIAPSPGRGRFVSVRSWVDCCDEHCFYQWRLD